MKIWSMRKWLPCCLVITIFLLCSTTSKSQSNKAIFLEGLGNGLLYSINYDFRFGSSPDGFGARFGFGGLYAQSDVLLTVPVLINYLLGEKGHYLEMGAGGGFYRFPDSIIGDYDYEAIVGATFSVGYRWQPTKGGFLFRIGWTPVFSNELSEPTWIGISVGYAFKK